MYSHYKDPVNYRCRNKATNFVLDRTLYSLHVCLLFSVIGAAGPGPGLTEICGVFTAAP